MHNCDVYVSGINQLNICVHTPTQTQINHITDNLPTNTSKKNQVKDCEINAEFGELIQIHQCSTTHNKQCNNTAKSM